MIEFERYTYENILKEALALVPEGIDKREGSVIYDALAPACYQLAGFYIEMKNFFDASFIESSYGEYLDRKVTEQGLQRIPSSKAIRKGMFTDIKGAAVVPIGTRFSTIEDQPLIYTVRSPYQLDGIDVPGTYLLECETEGVAGNQYNGDLLPVSHINLETAVMLEVVVPARDAETDDDLRKRYMEAVKNKSFGGNIAQYRKEIKEIDGVGDLQIYPTWNGGGSVKCSIIGSDFRKASDDLISTVQEIMDPVSGGGLGLAPIGHSVTICSPLEKTIDVSCRITLMMGYTIQQLHPHIVRSIENYLETLRKNWAQADSLNHYEMNVYVAQILSSIMAVPGVANVTLLKLNGESYDLRLQETSIIQELPVLGTITYEN